MCGGVVGIEANRIAEGISGGGDGALMLQGKTELHMRQRELRRECDCSSRELLASREISEPRARVRQICQRQRIVRFDRQRSPKRFRRRSQLTALEEQRAKRGVTSALARFEVNGFARRSDRLIPSPEGAMHRSELEVCSGGIR